MRLSRSGALRAFVLDARASAGIELGFGAVALLGVAALCFDLYSRVETDTAAARVAATMADYVSRGADAEGDAPDGASLKSIGAFLNAHELGTAFVFVISAFKQPAGSPAPAAKVLWSDDSLRFGNATVTAALAGRCARFVADTAGTTTASLPDGFTLDTGEVAVAVELCARPTGAGWLTGRFMSGDIYRHHVLPVRAPERAFPAPVHARLGADLRARV